MIKLKSNLFLMALPLILISNNVFALQTEKWVKYTCRGPVTPKGKVPTLYKDIMVAHFRITEKGVPSAKQLYEMDAPRFQAVTDLCSERRWQQTDTSGWTGNAGHTSYLDWETDLLYERYTISMVEFNPDYSRRVTGSPCDEQSVCLQSRELGKRSVCNLITHTCELSTDREIRAIEVDSL